MMRVLITGGRGYIGGRLVRRLTPDPAFKVTLASRISAAAGSNVRVVDWQAPSSIKALCEAQDAIVHLAAMNESDCASDPEQALRMNGLATLALARAARDAGISRFVYISTSKVFGNNPNGRLSETDAPRPVSHYAITHHIAEDYILAATANKELEGLVLRLSNGIGTPSDPSTNVWMLIANDFCRQVATTRQIVVRGSGMAWRNFISMDDVVEAIRHTLLMPRERVGDGLFHLGGTRSCRIWDLAQLIAERAEHLFGERVEIQRAMPASNEQLQPLEWRIDKLIATGWTPKRTLTDDIDETLRLCRDIFSRSVA